MAIALHEPVRRFGLFGETLGTGDPEFFHIEDIQSRSRLYRWRIAPHAHTRMFQLVWLDVGPARIGIEGAETFLEGPAAIAVPGNVVHSFVFDERSSGQVVTVSEARMIEVSAPAGLAPFAWFQQGPQIISFAQGPESANAGALLEQMAGEFQRRDSGREAVFFWLLQSVLVLLQRQADLSRPGAGKAGYRRAVFMRLEQLVEECFREQWNMDAIAEALAIGAQRLNRICREYSGKSVLELLHDRIMLEARRHLVYTAAPVEAIAFELGFADPGYFCRFFKRNCSTSPGQYRREREGEDKSFSG